MGPYSFDALRRMAATGQLSAVDFVWSAGMPDWAAAEAIPDLLPTDARGGGGQPVFPTQAENADNPYAAPAAEDSSFVFADTGPFEYADYLPRVGATILDGIFLALMTWIPMFVVTIILIASLGEDTGAVLGQLISNVFGFVVGVAYYVGFETSSKQATWGKQIVGIKVTDLEGRRISVGKAVGRYFAKILTGCTLGFGYLMPLFTEKKQTLHDLICGCLAVKQQ
jgi:uncharacterized RDD family membrane protein YckC